MTARRSLSPPHSAAVRLFIAAVRALSDDPRQANVARYLAASRAMDDSRLPQKTSVKRVA
jgi:hypothetical protein